MTTDNIANRISYSKIQWNQLKMGVWRNFHFSCSIFCSRWHKKTRNDHYSFDSCQFSHQIPPYLWNGVYFCRRRNFYNISYRIDHSIHLNHINAYQKSSCVKWYGLAVYWLLTFSYFCNVFANLNSFLVIIELEFRIKNKYKWLCVSLRSNTRSDEFMPEFFNMPNKDSHIQFNSMEINRYLFISLSRDRF